MELLKKKLLYKATHRGSKELDIVFGDFIKKHLNDFSKKELEELILITDYDDMNLWELLSGNKFNIMNNFKAK